MSTLLTIGEFSRLTHLSVKQLRNYDDIGLLAPADVDPMTGYRQYATAQAPDARVIRRLRDLDMPLDEIRIVLRASDVTAREEAIVAHLKRMEDTLAQTQAMVGSLRALLEGTEPAAPVTYRSVPAMRAVAIHGKVRWDDVEEWLAEAFDDLHEVIGAPADTPLAPDSALYSPEFFESHTGDVTAFIAIDDSPDVTGRVKLINIPAADLAVTVHRGRFEDLDQAYAALGTVVAERGLGTDGPIWEHYLTENGGTGDPAVTATEVCWPITHIPDQAT